MFRRLRQSRISLAAKCQLLFGIAVATIIFAALFVPFQRMEQLTEQLNEKAAGAVCDAMVNDHVARETAQRSAATLKQTLKTWPATETVSATKNIATTTRSAADESVRESASESVDDPAFPPPRLIPVSALKSVESLSKFEASALLRFSRDPHRRAERRYYDTQEGARGYLYAEPLYAQNRCIACHSAVLSAIAMPVSSRTDAMTSTQAARPASSSSDPAAAEISIQATTQPTSQPTSQPNSQPNSQPSTQQATQPALLGMISVDLPSQIQRNEVLLNQVFLLVAGIIAGTLAIVIFYLITTRLILQPVRVLQETAQRVSDGDLNIRSDINTGDEFQQLSETFNTMLFNLKSSSDQLRAVNKGLDLKLGQMAETNVALYESNRLKNEFLANVSHELRTPLNSILGFAELLKDQVPAAAAGDSKAARYLQNILGSGNSLLDLINDLLDLAKIEAGRVDVRVQPLSASDLVEGLLNLLRPLADKKQIVFEPLVAPHIPILQTDSAKLQQVLYNLLSNAIKFSPIGEKITLAASRHNGEEIRFSITDRGPGIAKDAQKLIFEKFRQLDASVTREHGGTGLGLAISKELTALLGGHLSLESEPGRGATFHVTIPLAIESRSHDLRGRVALN